jgi:hypothetical protein
MFVFDMFCNICSVKVEAEVGGWLNLCSWWLLVDVTKG